MLDAVLEVVHFDRRVVQCTDAQFAEIASNQQRLAFKLMAKVLTEVCRRGRGEQHGYGQEQALLQFHFHPGGLPGL